MNDLEPTAIHPKDLLTGTQVKTGELLSERQADDLAHCRDVKPRHITARKNGVLGVVIEELSGIRGFPFLIAHLDEDGTPNGTVGAYFACELFRPF